MKILQVTIGASATQLAADVPVRQVIIQNNAGHAMRIGDSSVDSTHGALLASGSPGGALNFGPFDTHADNLRNYWVSGTQNDVVDIAYIP